MLGKAISRDAIESSPTAWRGAPNERSFVQFSSSAPVCHPRSAIAYPNGFRPLSLEQFILSDSRTNQALPFLPQTEEARAAPLQSPWSCAARGLLHHPPNQTKLPPSKRGASLSSDGQAALSVINSRQHDGTNPWSCLSSRSSNGTAAALFPPKCRRSPKPGMPNTEFSCAAASDP